MLELKDVERGRDNSARLLLSDGWDAWPVPWTWKPGTAKVDLRLSPHDGLGFLENARYSDGTPSQALTFSGHRGHVVTCSGMLGEEVVELHGEVFGEVVVFRDKSRRGTFILAACC